MKKKNLVKKSLFVIFVFALLVRIVFAVWSFNNNITAKFSDDNAYMDFAKNIQEQGPLVLDIELLSPTEQIVGPGLPWIMALFNLVFGGGWLSIFFLNAFIGALTCILIFQLGREIFNEKVAFWIGLWSTFYVLFIRYIPTAGKEVWMTFLLTLIIYLILKIKKKDYGLKYKYWTVFLLAGVFTLLLHVDERYFIYFPLIALVLVWIDENKWRTGLQKSTLFVVSVFVLIIPWLVRNYIVYDNIVLISVRTTKFTQHIFNYKAEDFYRFKIRKSILSEKEINEVVAGEKDKYNNGKKIDPRQIKAMKNGVLPHKFSKLESMWSVFQILWKPVDLNRGYSTTGYRYDGVWSLRHNLTVGLTYGLLIPFLIWGFILLIRQQRKIGIFLISVLVYHSLIHMLFIPFTRNRYHIPVDAIIIVIGIYGMINIIDRFKLSYFNKKRS